MSPRSQSRPRQHACTDGCAPSWSGLRASRNPAQRQESGWTSVVLVPDLARLCVAGRGDATRTVILNILEELRTAPMNLFPRDSHNISIRSVCGVRRLAPSSRSRAPPPRPRPPLYTCTPRGARGSRGRAALSTPPPLSIPSCSCFVTIAPRKLDLARIFQLLTRPYFVGETDSFALFCYTRESFFYRTRPPTSSRRLERRVEVLCVERS